MNMSEARRKLNISYQGIYRATKRGSLKCKVVDGQFEYSIEDIREYANRTGKGNRTKGVTRKYSFPVATFERPLQKEIYDPILDETKILTQCKCCKKFKEKIFQFGQCAECLNPKFERLIRVINDVRGLA